MLALDCRNPRPMKYLYHNYGRYGFTFRMKHFGPADRPIEPCLFCGQPNADTGQHTLMCTSALEAVPLPSKLMSAETVPRRKALSLADSADSTLRNYALEWMQMFWIARRTRRTRSQHHLRIPNPIGSSSRSSPSPLLASSSPADDNNFTDPVYTSVEPSVPVADLRASHSRKRGRWSACENACLQVLISEGYYDTHRDLAQAIGSRTPAQVAERLRRLRAPLSRTTRTSSSFTHHAYDDIDTTLSADDRPPQRKRGRWSSSEEDILLRALNAASPDPAYALPTVTVPGRDTQQVREKIRCLSRSRTLVRDSSGTLHRLAKAPRRDNPPET